MYQTGCISVGRMDICHSRGEISQIIAALCSFMSKANGVITTKRVDQRQGQVARML